MRNSRIRTNPAESLTGHLPARVARVVMRLSTVERTLVAFTITLFATAPAHA
jgi:hypothetical protein